jgi:hypothetical protein
MRKKYNTLIVNSAADGLAGGRVDRPYMLGITLFMEYNWVLDTVGCAVIPRALKHVPARFKSA